MDDPYIHGYVTRLKIVLPCSRKKAWRLIATPKGLSSWFPAVCKGRVVPGRSLQFGWTGPIPEDFSDKFRVLAVKKGKSWQMDWWKTGKVRYSIDGSNPTIFTLEARYSKSAKGKSFQLPELAGWSFYLTNLKSVAMNGPDLRNKNPKFSWKKGFID